MASMNMISPGMYREWVWPYHRKIFLSLRDQLAPGRQFSMIHMCGNNMAILEDMIRTGVDLIETDSAMEMGSVADTVAGRAAIIGNIDPVHILKDGTADDVRLACRQAIAGGIRNRRFILGTGCFVCPGTPVDNLRALVNSVR